VNEGRLLCTAERFEFGIAEIGKYGYPGSYRATRSTRSPVVEGRWVAGHAIKNEVGLIFGNLT
jgi:hypothetical protein